MKLGLTFEEAVALSMVAGTFISAGPIIFGEPMAPGWVTPAVPIVMGALAASGYYGIPTEGASTCVDGVCRYNPEAFQFMAAMCFEFTALILILGLTGWGKILVEKIPNGLKAFNPFGIFSTRILPQPVKPRIKINAVNSKHIAAIN